MIIMYRMFQKTPSKQNLKAVINYCQKKLSDTLIDFRGVSKLSITIAKSCSDQWLSQDDNPNNIFNKNEIDNNFFQILYHLDEISKNLVSEELRNIYINLINEYSKKITNVYQL